MAIFPSAVSTNSDVYIAVNQKSTTLTDNPLSNVATTVNVTSTSGFPTVGFISIDSEIIKYTGTTATSFTGCTRGADGTTAASHSLNATVYHNVIAAHHNAVKDEIIAIEQNLSDRLGLSATRIIPADGSASAPTYSFGTEPGLGWYRSGTSRMSLAFGTIEGAFFDGSIGVFGLKNNYNVQTNVGTAGAPGYSFNGDSDTGIWRISTDTLGFATAGIDQWQLGSTGTLSNNNSAAKILNGDGSVTAPSFAFTNDTNTGIYSIAADTLGIATNGSMVASFGTTGGVAIKGSTLGDSAATGFVGEEIIQTRLRSARTALTTATPANVTATALSLTAGDWELSGVVQFEAAATTTVNERRAAISITSATLPSDNTIAVADSNGQMTVLNDVGGSTNRTQYTAIISPHKISISSTTTFYLVANSTFGVSTMEVYGTIRARRVR